MTTLKVVKKSGGYSGDIVIPSTVYLHGSIYIVTEVASEAFSNCTNLKSVVLNNSVKIIGDYAFAGCRNLTSVELPGPRSLGTGVFNDCRSLSTIHLPEEMTSIGDLCFHGAGLTSIELPWNR